MQTIAKFVSTNGRFGVEIVGDWDQEANGRFDAAPQRGQLVPLGRSGGFLCFRFEARTDDHFVVIGSDLVAVAGAVVVAAESLQSNDYVTLLHVTIGSVWQSFSYKRRSSEFLLLGRDGQTVTPSAGILLAAGVITPTEAPKALEPVPAFSNAMADALRKAGVVL